MLQYYMGKDERVRRPNKQNSSTLSLGVHHCAPLVVGTEFLSRENIETKKNKSTQELFNGRAGLLKKCIGSTS